jgi:flavin reductase (DIM6/NTAB) family NADH-FMN oxidoreductase RutF
MSSEAQTATEKETHMDAKQAQHQIIDHLASDWGLLTAGTIDDYNTMTIAWGETGTMWWLPVVSAYVVPTRHTWGYVEDEDYFVISLFGPEHKGDLRILGSKSGRDGDKVAETSLTPRAIEHGVTFEEATLTIVCRKLYHQPLDRDAIPADLLEKYYGDAPVHDLYKGEIVEVIEG